MPKQERFDPATPDDQNEIPTPPAVDEIPKGMDLINHVARCLAIGCDPLDVRNQLMTFGFTEAAAEKYVADTVEWMRRNPNAGKSTTAASESVGVNLNMVIGAVVCVIGIGVTAFSYATASGRGGGIYIIAWGAILFGAIQFILGFIQSVGPNQSRGPDQTDNAPRGD